MEDNIQAQATGEVRLEQGEAAQGGEENVVQFYTPEEIEGLNPEAIDIEKVDPAARPIVERTIRDYKALQGDYTKKSQELSELKKATPPEPETYFHEPQKDTVFKDYLKDPLRVITDINNEIVKLETVIPDDGIEEFRQARKGIAYWNGIKDEFQAKRIDVIERRKLAEVDEAKMLAELGADADAFLKYASDLGFSEKQLRSNPKLREGVKKVYAAANAGKTAQLKEIKSGPQKTAAPSGRAGGGATETIDEFDPKLSTEERIALGRKRRAAGG